VDRSSVEGALVKAPKAPRGVRCGEGCTSPCRRRLEGARLLPKFFLLFTSKWSILVLYLIKLDLMEETRTQLQEEEAGGNCLLLPDTGYAYAGNTIDG